MRGDRNSREGEYKIVFWNVAGLENKDTNFWEMMEECNVIMCIEKKVSG